MCLVSLVNNFLVQLCSKILNMKNISLKELDPSPDNRVGKVDFPHPVSNLKGPFSHRHQELASNHFIKEWKNLNCGHFCQIFFFMIKQVVVNLIRTCFFSFWGLEEPTKSGN